MIHYIKEEIQKDQELKKDGIIESSLFDGDDDIRDMFLGEEDEENNDEELLNSIEDEYLDIEDDEELEKIIDKIPESNDEISEDDLEELIDEDDKGDNENE
jgi:hypothetical protein